MSEYFKNKNVLVTGASGFIGTNLIERLTALGSNVRGSIHKNDLRNVNPSVEYIQADLMSEEDCSNLVKNIDYVFMCAANTSGAKVIENNPLEHLNPNIIMNIQLLNACYKESVDKVLFISSNTVYPDSDKAVLEDDINYDFFYKYHIVGWMKLFSEKVCEIYSSKINKKMPSLVVRPANIFGPYDDFDLETAHVIPALIKKFVEQKDEVEVWGDGSELKEFIFIDDFIDAMLMCFEKLETYDPVNISINNPISVKDIVDIIKKETKSTASIKYNKDKPTMIKQRKISNKKLINTIGYTPKVSIEDGLKKTINWFEKQYNVNN